MKVKPSTDQVERRLKRAAMKGSLQAIAAAAFSAKTTGGFQRLVDGRQGEWRELSPDYVLTKRRRGQDVRKWVRTGRTLAALTQGVLAPVTRMQKGVKFEISRTATATLLVQSFRPQRGRKPGAKDQRAIQFLQDRRRPILDWVREDRKIVRQFVEEAIRKQMREKGDLL